MFGPLGKSWWSIQLSDAAHQLGYHGDIEQTHRVVVAKVTTVVISNKTTDPLRIEVWEAMAAHFLDTETRHNIPLTALWCLEAGLSPTEAREVWRYEVSPVVWHNAWAVAGEWAGWDREWLVRRIERLRKRWPNRPGICASLVYRARVHLMHGNWQSIERCLDAIRSADTQSASQQMAQDLAFLARHYFDFCPDNVADLERVQRARVRRLYPELFQTIMAPALVPGEAIFANRRGRAALAQNL